MNNFCVKFGLECLKWAYLKMAETELAGSGFNPSSWPKVTKFKNSVFDVQAFGLR